MKTIQFIKICVLSMLIVGCGQDKKEKSNSMQTDIHQFVQKEGQSTEIESNFTKSEIAKFTIAAIMNQKPENLNVKQKEGVFYVAYKRPDDEKKQEYKIRINANRIIWGNVPGRWRTTKKDEKITFKEDGKQLSIIQTLADGSNTVKEFSK